MHRKLACPRESKFQHRCRSNTRYMHETHTHTVDLAGIFKVQYVSCILIAILHFFLNHFTTKIPETPSEPVQVHGYGLDGYWFHMGAGMGRGQVTCGLPMMCTIFCQEM